MADHFSVTPLRHPIPITEQEWPKNIPPLLTIACITYNHERFIRRTIEGFLIQETTFPVEIVIHDDASQDGTADIAREYELRYPSLIKCVSQKENQYARGKKPSELIREFIRGNYVAHCEGDDFWTDTAKLQIQVAYLEGHEDCVVSCHDAYSVDEEGKLLSRSIVPRQQKRDFGPQDLLHGHVYLPTMSRVYRNVFPREPIPELRNIVYGDMFMTSYLGQFGGSHFHPEIKPAQYNVHRGGLWSMQSAEHRRRDHIVSCFWIHQYWQRMGMPDVADVWLDKVCPQSLHDSSVSGLLRTIAVRLFAIIRVRRFRDRWLAKRSH